MTYKTRLTKTGKVVVIGLIYLAISILLVLPIIIQEVIELISRLSYTQIIAVFGFGPAFFLIFIGTLLSTVYELTYQVMRT